MTGTMHPAMTLPVRPATCGDVRATVLDWSERRPHAVDALFSAIGDALAKGEPCKHHRVRNLLGEEPPGPAEPESPHGRGHRDRSLEGAVVQAREETSRRGRLTPGRRLLFGPDNK